MASSGLKAFAVVRSDRRFEESRLIMIQPPHFIGICIALVSLSLASCASGPQKQDPLDALDAEDSEESVSDAESSADGSIPFREAEMTRPGQIGGPSFSIPPRAIEKRVKGVWVARCVITETGSVEGCRILKSLPESNAHLLQILRAQKYAPVMYKGNPQRVFYTFKITFK